MAAIDWERLDRFADQHQAAGLLGLAAAALYGVEHILDGLPTPDQELRQLLLRAGLRAAVLRREAVGQLGGRGDLTGVVGGALKAAAATTCPPGEHGSRTLLLLEALVEAGLMIKDLTNQGEELKLRQARLSELLVPSEIALRARTEYLDRVMREYLSRAEQRITAAAEQVQALALEVRACRGVVTSLDDPTSAERGGQIAHT